MAVEAEAAEEEGEGSKEVVAEASTTIVDHVCRRHCSMPSLGGQKTDRQGPG